jgi:hypothetical protein
MYQQSRLTTTAQTGVAHAQYVLAWAILRAFPSDHSVFDAAWRTILRLESEQEFSTLNLQLLRLWAIWCEPCLWAAADPV